MQTKLATLRQYMAAGDYRAALRLAAGWPRLGPQRATITRAWAAWQNPAFYAELGHDPQRLIDAGLAAIRTRYGIPQPG
jgi:hypothetical protein